MDKLLQKLCIFCDPNIFIFCMKPKRETQFCLLCFYVLLVIIFWEVDVRESENTTNNMRVEICLKVIMSNTNFDKLFLPVSYLIILQISLFFAKHIYSLPIELVYIIVYDYD